LAERFGLHEQWLDHMTGNRSRYFCRLDTPPGVPQSTSDLATDAGAKALAAAGIGPGDLDFLILTTASPDHLMPATVNLVADRLGINNVPTLQITSGCAGALQGLFTARAFLASGMRRGLVIGADTCLKLWPSRRDVKQMKPAEMINFALFGDGAGAAVVDADMNGPGSSSSTSSCARSGLAGSRLRSSGGSAPTARRRRR
jgi:3-oxoacyl-[acyl-carrier-protein] synthase-3